MTSPVRSRDQRRRQRAKSIRALLAIVGDARRFEVEHSTAVGTTFHATIGARRVAKSVVRSWLSHGLIELVEDGDARRTYRSKISPPAIRAGENKGSEGGAQLPTPVPFRNPRPVPDLRSLSFSAFSLE